MSSKEKILATLITIFLYLFLFGIIGAPAILSLASFFILIPLVFYFAIGNKINFREYPKSAFFLFCYVLVLTCSVIFNQNVIAEGYGPVSKSRYFIIALLSFSPCIWYFRNKIDSNKISKFLYYFFILAIAVNILGLIGMYFNFNFATFKPHEVVGRNHGLMRFVYHYGQSLALFLSIVVSLLFNKKKSEKYVNTKFLFGLFVFGLISFFCTFSRAGWLGFAMAVPFVFFFEDKKKFLASYLMIIVLGVGVYALAGNKTKRSDNDQTRIGLWKAAVIAASERPLLGYGYTNLKNVTQRIKRENNLPYPEFRGTAHSNYFEALGSMGYLGLFAFLAWSFSWFYEILKRKDGLSLTFFVTFMVGGITEPSFFISSSLVFVLGAYIVGHCWHLTSKEKVF